MCYCFLILFLPCILVTVIPCSECKEYKLGLLIPRHEVHFGWDINAAAATMAIEQCEKNQLLNGNTIRLLYRDDGCNAKDAAGIANDLRWNFDVDGFIGSPCDHPAEIVGHVASFWDLPVFSQFAVDPELRDKEIFPTLVRMGAPFIRLGPAVGEMLSYFKWKQVVMLIMRSDDKKGVFCGYSARAIEGHFRNSDVNLADSMEFDKGLSADQIDAILIRAKQRGRIIVLCASLLDEHHFLVRAEANQMTSGDFLFITFHYVPPSYIKTPWTYKSPYTDNPDLQRMYKNVLQVSLASLSGPKTDMFLQELPRKMTQAPWFYNSTLESGKLGSKYSIFLHDVMYLYCLALNDTLQQGGDPRNGTLMFNNAKSRVFKGITGPVAIDDNADKLPNYDLWHMNKEGTSFQVWTEIDMVQPQGQRMNVTRPATWNTKDGSAPRDRPVCGFMNEHCPPYDLVMIAISIVICITAAVLMAVIVNYIVRRQKYKKDLQKMLWKIAYKDLCPVKSGRRFESACSVNSTHNLALEVTSVGSAVDVTGKCVLLHGVTVSLHKISTSKLTLNNKDTMELHVMRQMTHENLNQFIGMSVEPPDVCIVSARCSRGTLQDVLATDEINLDAVFKKSLLHDLVSGVTYIHNSELKSHGNLSSDSCLIDNHWVLKVANFGIQNIRKSTSQQKDNGEYQMCRDLLWTAPEILRQAECDREPNGSKEGDVYSVGIITQEIMFRCMPFGSDLDPKEIVKKVKETQDPPFRPNLDDLSRQSDFSLESRDLELMMSCWNELPQLRPKITHVKKTIHQSYQGKSVIDNMLAIMEKYANNLEEIVDTRTAELVEEKKKTDLLLYSMLPKQVAEKLKIGELVEPEMYEAVTVFFSDIVGFTQLSSESTPIQIVHLLNDLYSLFDDIITKYDVYKVETIGDAYMLVSGLPQSNGDQHASEIANTALDLLKAVSTQFNARHKAGHQLQLRTGINTGPCAAGVVGLKMPRYCLFGDTVNTASRMESSGEALKIHISESCEGILRSIGGFIINERGEIEIKGKGMQRTYWLLGKECA